MKTKAPVLALVVALAVLATGTSAPAQQMSVGAGDKPRTYNATSSTDPVTGQFVQPPPKPLAYGAVAGSPFTLTSSWAKVATNAVTTKAFCVSQSADAASYDVELTSVTAGASAPTATYGTVIGFGRYCFAEGLPIGDVYAKSASGQKLVVEQGN